MCHGECSQPVQRTLVLAVLQSPDPNCASLHSRQMSVGCRLVESILDFADDAEEFADSFVAKSRGQHPAAICVIRVEPRWAAIDSNRESGGSGISGDEKAPASGREPSSLLPLYILSDTWPPEDMGRKCRDDGRYGVKCRIERPIGVNQTKALEGKVTGVEMAIAVGRGC
ncbi:hypothetical protein E4U35_005110 [Claviceps purpurea]|nr:hypothetical protein E4U35_005110 [Claviceps purpurea]